MSHTHRRIRRIHRLTTRARRAEHIHLNLRLGNLNSIRLLNQRNHLNRRKRRLAAALIIERRNTHQAVSTRLHRQATKSVRRVHLEGHRLQARLLSVGGVQNLRRVAVLLRPTQVHAQQHLREISSVHATGARTDRYHSLTLIVLTREQHQHLKLFQLGADLTALAFSISEQLGGGLLILRFGKLHHHLNIINARRQRTQTIQLRLLIRQCARHLLRVLHVIPQIGCGSLRRQVLNGALNPLNIAHSSNRVEDRAKLFNLSRKVEGCHSF